VRCAGWWWRCRAVVRAAVEIPECGEEPLIGALEVRDCGRCGRARVPARSLVALGAGFQRRVECRVRRRTCLQAAPVAASDG
jgi:hypothetical protein